MDTRLFYDSNNKRILPRNTIPIPPHICNIGAAGMTDEHLVAYGYYPAVPLAVPAGGDVVGSGWVVSGAVAYQSGTVRTADEIKADADAAEGARLMGLVESNRERLITIAGLLAVFDLPLPSPYSEAQAAVYAQSKADPSKAADGVLLMRLWDEFEAAVNEPDRMTVAAMVKGGA